MSVFGCVLNVGRVIHVQHAVSVPRFSPTIMYCVCPLTRLRPDSFCLSLQLEVLHSQTLMLVRERWGDLVQVERYHAAKYLTLAVWK